MYMRLIRTSGSGNCLFLHSRGWGIYHQERKKNCKSPGVCPEGMVTGQIEPCIRGLKFEDQLNLKWQNLK